LTWPKVGASSSDRAGTNLEAAHKELLVVSRLGLEPRALALKAPRLMKKINTMTLHNRPMSDKPRKERDRLRSFPVIENLRVEQSPCCSTEESRQASSFCSAASGTEQLG
jgi:hypothetical protein